MNPHGQVMTFCMATPFAGHYTCPALARSWRRLGGILEAEMTARIYLTGHVALEHDDRLIAEDALPGRQGRLAFVFLVLNRMRPVTRAELSDVLWPDEPPAESEAAIAALLSKLRGVLKSAGLSADAGIDARSNAIGIRLPPDVWVDLEAAANALDEAEGALRAGDPARAWGCANVAVSIAQRPLLPDHDGAWIEGRRAAQQALLTRG